MKRAYVTMLCGGDGYLPGAKALANSLHATGTAEPLVAMVTPDVTPAGRTRLAGDGWTVVEVQPIDNPMAAEHRLFDRFGGVFTKLNAWNLTDYDKLVYVDADTLVLRNVDELFERRDFAAAPDFFRPDHFNSGVMVLEPSRERYTAMLEALPATRSYDGGDQGFLNVFLGDWWAKPVENRLPFFYNVHNFIYQFMTHHPRLKDEFAREVRVVHYTVQKPWRAPLVTGGSELWWRNFRGTDEAPWWRELHALEDWSFERLMSTLGV